LNHWHAENAPQWFENPNCRRVWPCIDFLEPLMCGNEPQWFENPIPPGAPQSVFLK
jgi:hypothetical protein